MKNVQNIQLAKDSSEEILPDFNTRFPYIATCAELDKYAGQTVPWHWHNAIELFYIESGSLKYLTPNGLWSFPKGSGGMVNANVLHSTGFVRGAESNIQLLHLFDPDFLSGGHGSLIEEKYILPMTAASDLELIPLYPENPAQAEILQMIRLAFTLSAEEFGYELKLRETLTQIWLKLYTHAQPDLKKGVLKNPDEKIKTMMVFIHEHFQEDISVAQLSAVVHISKRTCFRIFQENLHMSPTEYIQAFRFQKACHLLAKTNEPVTKIAYDCGFGSCSYFAKLFRAKFGCTPLAYRKQWHDSYKNGHK